MTDSLSDDARSVQPRRRCAVPSGSTMHPQRKIDLFLHHDLAGRIIATTSAFRP